MSRAIDCPPDGTPWRPVDLSERPPNHYIDLTEGDWELAAPRRRETRVEPPREEGPADPERLELERRTGLPLTKLSLEEWSRVQLAATKFAARKLGISFNAATGRYQEFIKQGYEAVKGRRGAFRRPSTSGTSVAEAAELGIGNYDRHMIERAEEFAKRHDMSFGEAAKYIV